MRGRLGLPPEIAPIFWGLLLLEASFGAYLSVWPLWIERLGAPVAVVGIILGAGGFLRLLVLIPSAGIAERLGYRRAILLSRAAAAIGMLSAAFATHWTHLALMLICSAIGELVFPLLQVLLAASTSGEERIRSFTLVFTVGPSIALIVSPLISGGLVALFGIPAAFVFAAACTAASLWSLARLHEPDHATMHGATGSSSYREALGDPGIRLIAMLLPLTVFTLSLGISFIPTFLEDERGMQPATISTYSAMAAVGTASFGIAVARLPRLQRAPFVAVAIAVATTAFGFLLFRSSALPLLLLIAFFCRGGLFSSWAMLSAALSELAPSAHRARAFAFCEMAGGLAFSLGPLVAALLYARRHTLPFDAAFLVCLALVPTLLLAQGRARRLRRAADASSLPEEVTPGALI